MHWIIISSGNNSINNYVWKQESRAHHWKQIFNNYANRSVYYILCGPHKTRSRAGYGPRALSLTPLLYWLLFLSCCSFWAASVTRLSCRGNKVISYLISVRSERVMWPPLPSELCQFSALFDVQRPTTSRICLQTQIWFYTQLSGGWTLPPSPPHSNPAPDTLLWTVLH